MEQFLRAGRGRNGGRLLRLDATRQANALALAAARCATPKSYAGGHCHPSRNMANALIAQSGVQAALLQHVI